jgi:parvulin-like peptidyl-prolyl isomerase
MASSHTKSHQIKPKIERGVLSRRSLTPAGTFRKVSPAGCMRFRKAISLTAIWLSAGLAVRGDTVVDFIQAIVGDAVITHQQILIVTRPREDTIIEQSADQTQGETRSAIIALRQDAFQSLIDRQVVLQEFKRLAKDKGYKIPDSLVDEQVQNVIREKYGGDRVRFDKELEASGMTREEFRQRQKDDIIYQLMREQFVPDPIISPLKVENYYHAHQDQFTVPARVKFRWIRIDRADDDTNNVARERMQEILSQLKDGAQLADLAQTYNTMARHSNLDAKDDEWLEIPKLNDAFRYQVSRLKAGEYTGVIEIPQGFLVLRVDEVGPVHVTPLDDVRADIGKILMVQEQNRRAAAWIARLKARTFIQTF